jgi:hypothetical protein
MAPRQFRELFTCTKRVYGLLLEEVGPKLPVGMSSNGMNITADHQLLTFLYCMTGNVDSRHAAPAVGMQRSKVTESIHNCIDAMMEESFLKKYLRLPTEVSILILYKDAHLTECPVSMFRSNVLCITYVQQFGIEADR